MNIDFKYLTQNPEDKNWGFYLTVAGSATVLPDAEYPPAGHPSGYNFTWQNGRILQEYQINYITEGEGIIETKAGTFPIEEGSMIILKPHEWHRYKPLKSRGWKEHYVGFNGDYAQKIIKNTGLLNDSPVIAIGFQETIINSFQEIFNYIRMERPGYHQVCSGLVIHILGQIISIKKNENFRYSNIEKALQKACTIIRDNPTNNINIEELALSLNVNYSLFRKAFKKYTGLSPMQYHTSLRLKQAVYLLNNTNLSLKEISFNLGFCSVFYFSKLFKEKTGKTPSDYRNKYRGGENA